MPTLDVAVLGPLDLRVDGREVALTGPRQRAVIAALALRANQVVSTDTIIDDVWGDEAPDRVGHSLQQQVSAVRKLLGAASGADGASLLVTRDPGYCLVVSAIDADRFERAAATGAAALVAGDAAAALTTLDDALACWRGAVLSDVPESSTIQAAAVRWEEHRVAVIEDRLDALLQLDRPRDAVAQLEHLVVTHPFRERLRAQQMLALYRSGRQSDALAAFQSAREALVDGLGIDPSPQLRDLERRILEQDPTLDAGRGATGPPPSGAVDATYRSDAGAAGRLELPDGQVVVLTDGAVSIGRDPAAAVRLVDSRVSRQHAEVVTVAGRSLVRDVGSTNGTFVDGVAVTECELDDGATVSLGGVELRYRAES